jgi:hypothetical protein
MVFDYFSSSFSLLRSPEQQLSHLRKPFLGADPGVSSAFELLEPGRIESAILG